MIAGIDMKIKSKEIEEIVIEKSTAKHFD